MQILVRFCVLVMVRSVLELYEGILRIFQDLLLMGCASCLKLLAHIREFKGGSFVSGYFAAALNILWLVLIFGLGLKFLEIRWHSKGLIQFLCAIRGKSSGQKHGFCSRRGFVQVCDSTVKYCMRDSLKMLGESRFRNKEDSFVTKELVNTTSDALGDESEREYCAEDEESDVMALRRLVKIERQRANMAFAELDKERMAAGSAAEEAMAMILRLQSEKSSIEIEANQFRKLAEQKLEYCEQVIESLQWDIVECESEKSELEENLRLCQQGLKAHEIGDEVNQDERI